MKRVLKYSIEDLRKLRTKAARGDKRALKTLRSENKRLAKIANRRMLELEKHKMDYYAYDRAAFYTKEKYKSKRFSVSEKKLNSPKLLFEQLSEMSLFIGRESSTVSGQRAIEDRRIETLANDPRWGYVFSNRDSAVEFLRFLGNKSVSSITKGLTKKYSGDITDIIYGAFEHEDFDKNEALTKFEKYQSGELYYDDLVQYFTQFNDVKR